jgi:hypothetical protein
MSLDLTWRSAARLIVPAVGLAAIAALALLSERHPDAYHAVFAFLGVETLLIRFADLQFTLGAIECAKHGVDVYVSDLCDPFGRAFDYSPIWLYATFLPGLAWSNSLGVCLAAAFYVSFGLLPPVTRPIRTVAMVAAALSPPVAFALERGNTDIVIFIALVIAIALLAGRRLWRLPGYALIFIAAALKFFPVTLAVLLLREPTRRILLILGIAAAAGIFSADYFFAELPRLVANLPHEAAFSNVFGASDLPDGITYVLFHGAFSGAERATKAALYGILLWRTAIGVVRLFRSRFRTALRGLPERELLYLVAGAALISGCFFAGRSIGYREIFLLLTLPGLLFLAGTGDDRANGSSASRAHLLVIVILWMGVITWGGLIPRSMIEMFGTAVQQRLYMLFWFIFELLWWQLMITLVAAVACVGADWLHVPNDRREK